MKTAILAVVVASLVVLAASADARPVGLDNAQPVEQIQNSRDAPLSTAVAENVYRSANPEWFARPGGTYSPQSEYEVTPDLEGRWHVFLDWFMLFTYLFGDGKGF